MAACANICHMCLKDNRNNDFVSLRRNRDLRLKFFYCFSISFPDGKEELLVCEPCVDKLNAFYQLKNHVQRAHSVIFQHKPPSTTPTTSYVNLPRAFAKTRSTRKTRANSTFDPYAQIPSLLDDRAITNSIEKDVARALQRLNQTPSPLFNNQRSQLVHSANFSTPQVLDTTESIDLDNFTPVNRFPYIIQRVNVGSSSEAASTSGSFIEIKQETQAQVKTSATTATKSAVPPPKGRKTNGRGKQRGEVGKLIYKDEVTQKYPCYKCPKVFSNYQSIYIHIRNIHLKIGHCYCDFCGKSYTKKALRVHIMSKHGKRYECNICLKSMKTEQDLHVHYRFKHQRKNSI